MSDVTVLLNKLFTRLLHVVVVVDDARLVEVVKYTRMSDAHLVKHLLNDVLLTNKIKQLYCLRVWVSEMFSIHQMWRVRVCACVYVSVHAKMHVYILICLSVYIES